MHHRPTDWFKFLPLAEWSYNTSLHSSTGITSFEVIYGKPPPALPHYIMGFYTNEVVDSILTSRTAIHDKAQTTMKTFTDVKRRPDNFEVGQWAYVKLRPYRQSSVSGTTHHKLTKCYFGPFEIIECVGHVAYHLRLPATSQIHPIFHCSMLHRYHDPTPP